MVRLFVVIFIFVIGLFFCSNDKTESKDDLITWEYVYGGSDEDLGKSLVALNDSLFVIGGLTESFAQSGYNGWLVAIDQNGKMSWEQNFGGSSFDWIESITASDNQTIFYSGLTMSYGNGDRDLWMSSCDEVGNQTWSNAYGGESYDWGEAIIVNSMNQLMIAGENNSQGETGEDFFWVMQTDINGNQNWEKFYDLSEDDYGADIVEAQNGSYYLCGSVWNENQPDGVVLCIGQNGDSLWNVQLGGGESDTLRSVIQDSQGDIVACGQTESAGAGGMDVWFVKLDSNGQVIWDKTLGGVADDWANALIEYQEGYIIAGVTRSWGEGKQDAWVIQINRNGQLVWQETHGGIEDEWTGDIIKTADGGLIMSGWTMSQGSGKRDLWVVKMNQNGKVD